MKNRINSANASPVSPIIGGSSWLGGRPHFTIRKLMAVVAIVGLILGFMIEVGQRRNVFVEKANAHMMYAVRTVSGDYAQASRISRYCSYHSKMAAKYEWAYRHPWFPVEPDPPEPPRPW